MTHPPKPRSLFAAPLALLLCAHPASLLAAENSPAPADTLPEVVVTATAPLETSLLSPSVSAAQERLRSIPGAVSVVPSTDFARGRGTYLEDFLRYQPGLVIASGQGSEDTHVSIRGSGQDNDDIIGLNILIDGIPINQGDGEAFLHDLDLQSVKYAEVYRGADALRYGGVTLGGAINLVTLTGRDADPFTARVSLGSFGFTEQAISSGWNSGPWDAYLSIFNHTLDGYRAFSQENYQKIFFSLGYKFSESAENRFYVFYGRLDQNNPSSLTKAAMYASPRQTEDEAVHEDWSTKWQYERLMDRFALKGDEWTFQISLEWNHRQQTQRSEFEDDFRLGAVRFYSDDYAADVVYESTADLFGAKNRFTAGLLPSFEAESDSFYANPNGNLGALLFADRTYYLNFPVFVENQHYFTKRFSVLSGFQAVYVDRIFKDRFDSATLGNQSHDDHFLALNPKLGVAWQWNDKSTVYLNVSRSFQPPSFDESIGVQEGVDGGQVFHELHSQKAITLELGTRGEAGPCKWDLAFYRSWVRDELLDLNNNQGVPLGTVNAPQTIHQGIEAGLEIEVAHSLLVKSLSLTSARDGKETRSENKTDHLVLQQTYNLSDFRFSGDPVYGNNRIAGTPVQFYKAELRYEHPSGIYFGPNVEWNIVKYPVDEANSLFADPYALLGFRAGYKTKKGLQLYFEVKNILNKTYAASVEPIADARSGDDTDSFNPGNGRAFYGGVSWIW
jgi:iron complex outermembrane recepter protein